jgi:hypothetical protein
LARWSVIFLFTQLALYPIRSFGSAVQAEANATTPLYSAQSAPATLHGSFASLRMTGSHLAPLQFDSNAPVHHLNQVINWYRHATTGVPSVGLPSDTIYQDNTNNLGAQVVKLAFQSAAEAALVKTQQKAAADTAQAGAATTQEPTVAVWPRLTSTAAKTFS